MKEEHMRNFSVAMYPATHKLYMELKEKNNWTHDQTIRELVKFYESKKEGLKSR